MDALSVAARTALDQSLEAGERIGRTLSAVGCALVLTDRRLVLVRDGAAFRRRTGVQSGPLDERLTLHLAPVRRGSGRLLIEHAGASTSVFLPAAQMNGARKLVAQGRRGSTLDRIEVAQPGIIPSCCASPKMSVVSHSSATRPSSTRRI